MIWPADDYLLHVLRKAISAQRASIDLSRLAMDTRLDALDLDSLEWVGAIGEVEEEIGVNLPDEELVKVKTIGDFAELIRTGRLP